MDNNDIKSKTVKGLFWSGIDKFVFEIVQFVVGIIMARLLMPSDYGVIGILLVFISFSTLFIDGGLTTALIQKNNRTEEDFSTAYVYNLVTSTVIYIFLFFLAPLISRIYNNPDIIWLLRVLTLNLIISAFSSVQNTKLTINIDFKKISVVSIVSGIVSGVGGIMLALYGFGVWALVCQQLLSATIKTILLNIITRWHPSFLFSKESFKELFGFSSKLILTNLLGRIYDNLYPLIIGKMFPFKTLGYYTRATQFANLPANTLKDVFMRVSFPVLSSIQNDAERLRKSYRIYIELSSFVIFPIMFILIVVAKPLILLILTEKWIESVPYLQILCLGFMFSHISAINLNLLYVKGRSDYALKLEIIKKTIAILILAISTLWGIWGICIGQAVYNIIATFLNSIYTKQLVSISYVGQLKDFGRVWVIGSVSSILPYIFIVSSDNYYFQIVIGSLIYICVYLLLNQVLKTGYIGLCYDTIKQR